MKHSALRSSLIASCLIHVAMMFVVSGFMSRKALVARQDFIPIELVEIPAVERKANERVAPKLATRKAEKIPESKSVGNKDTAAVERSTPSRPTEQQKEEVAKFTESKPSVAVRPEQVFAPTAAGNEDAGSQAGSGNHFSKGDVALVPGGGKSAGNGGTAISGLGTGSRALDFPGKEPVLTQREARPIQTVRASYPPMALRMGLEGDVVLKIQVDTEGNVVKTELIKGAGMGFDEEALKVVKQSRFEPAQKDGKNVPAEFTYTYRFRLAR